MNRTTLNYIVTVLGLMLLGVGLYLIKIIAEPQGVMLALPYVCIGVGCGTFGHGLGEIISRRAIKNHPEIEKQIEIDKQDERNVAIANRAKSKAYDMMIFVFGALILTFALMGVDMVDVLLLVFAYLFVVGYSIFYRVKFDKEM